MFDDFSTNVMTALSDLQDLSKSSSEYNNVSLQPVDLKIDGADSIKTMSFLFSPSVDKMVDALLDVCINGKFDVALEKLNQFVKMFDSMGVGQGFFNGQVGSHIIAVIKSSVNSVKFQKTSSKIKKTLIVLKNLKRQAKRFNDLEVRQKYQDAIYAISSVIQVIASLYRQRNKINSRVLKGLNNVVFESEEDDVIKLGKITF